MSEQTGADVSVQNETASMAELESYENSFKNIKVGDYVKGRIEKIDNEGITVNLGGKTDGIVPATEISEFNSAPADFQVGDEIDVVVLKRKGGAEGEYILSKKKADRELGWKRVIEAFEKGETITATCTDAVKGGIIVDIGVRGFVPASQVDVRPVKDLSELVGEELKLKIIELDSQKKKVVLSRKEIIIEEKNKAKAEIIGKIHEGDIIQGEVARLTNFGAFVNLGGIDGLIHISEMSWKRINHPSDVISVGEHVNVLVLKVDAEKDKIALSLRQAKPDPWLVAEEKFPVNSTVEGKITKLAKKYVFVELMDGIEGLIPISEISNERISSPEDVLKLGQTVTVKVLEVKGKDRRMLLSMKAANPEKPRSQKSKNDYAEYMSDKPSSATIGNILKSKDSKTISEVVNEA